MYENGNGFNFRKVYVARILQFSFGAKAKEFGRVRGSATLIRCLNQVLKKENKKSIKKIRGLDLRVPILKYGKENKRRPTTRNFILAGVIHLLNVKLIFRFVHRRTRKSQNQLANTAPKNGPSSRGISKAGLENNAGKEHLGTLILSYFNPLNIIKKVQI